LPPLTHSVSVPGGNSICGAMTIASLMTCWPERASIEGTRFTPWIHTSGPPGNPWNASMTG